MAYFGERKLGNFKTSKTTLLKAKTRKSNEKRAERPGNSEEHLEALRKCPCVISLRVPAGEVHHLKSGTGERGAGMRSSDKWGLPLAHAAHMELEREGSRNERAWFERHGIDAPLDLAAALWNASPNVALMTKIILANRGKK
jgi:hypothetical protein